jgi:hypothetical protein
VLDQLLRDPPPFAGVGDEEEEEQVPDGDREELSELEHRHLRAGGISRSGG